MIDVYPETDYGFCYTCGSTVLADTLELPGGVSEHYCPRCEDALDDAPMAFDADAASTCGQDKCTEKAKTKCKKCNVIVCDQHSWHDHCIECVIKEDDDAFGKYIEDDDDPSFGSYRHLY